MFCIRREQKSSYLFEFQWSDVTGYCSLKKADYPCCCCYEMKQALEHMHRSWQSSQPHETLYGTCFLQDVVHALFARSLICDLKMQIELQKRMDEGVAENQPTSALYAHP